MLKTYFHALYRSIFSPILYADVIKRWKGTGTLYLLFLSFLVALLLSFRLGVGLHTVPQNSLEHLFDQIPDITIEQGTAQTGVEKPHDIILKNGQTILRILEEVDLETVKDENEGVPIILGPKNIILIPTSEDEGSSKMRVHSLSDTQDLIINHELVESVWNKAKWFLPLVVLPFVALGVFVGYFLQSLLVALLSYIVTAFLKEEYVFETRLRMSTIALTPVIFVNQFSEIILSHKISPPIIILMAVLYIYVMVKTSRTVK